MMTLYPAGYGTDMVSMDVLVARFGKYLHPEFHRRLFAWIESMDGLIGCGQTYRAVQPSKPGFAPPGMSFHEKQKFASGLFVVSAVDLVARAAVGNPNPAHRSPTWEESGTSPNYGVYTFVKGEPWHMQCVEMRGYQTWVNAGRPDPQYFTLPGTIPPPVTPTPTQEVDMILIKHDRGGGDWTGLSYTGTQLAHVTTSDAWSVPTSVGVPVVNVSDTQLDALIRSAQTTNACPPEWVSTPRGAAWAAQRG